MPDEVARPPAAGDPPQTDPADDIAQILEVARAAVTRNRRGERYYAALLGTGRDIIANLRKRKRDVPLHVVVGALALEKKRLVMADVEASTERQAPADPADAAAQLAALTRMLTSLRDATVNALADRVMDAAEARDNRRDKGELEHARRVLVGELRQQLGLIGGPRQG